MMLRHHWTPPPQVRGSVAQMKDELVFPLVYDNTDDPTRESGDPIKTHFGLWFIDPVNAEERFVTAPFFIKSEYGKAQNSKWRLLTAEDGRLIGVLTLKASYDLRYHFFTYDGSAWAQVMPQEDGPRRSQQFIFSEQITEPWEEPGELDPSSYMVFGGGLATAGEPLSFAADYTHAFSYDSGPMTPTAPEYTEMLERAARTSIPGLSMSRINLLTRPDVVAVLPADHRVHHTTWTHFWSCEVPGGYVIADWDHSSCLHSVVCIDTGSQ